MEIKDEIKRGMDILRKINSEPTQSYDRTKKKREAVKKAVNKIDKPGHHQKKKKRNLNQKYTSSKSRKPPPKINKLGPDNGSPLDDL